MSTFVNAGRTVFARLLKERHAADPHSVFIAFGNGQVWWGEEQTETIAFDGGDQLVTAYPHADGVRVPGALPVRVSTPDGLTVYTAGDDYAVTASTGIVTRMPTGAIAALADVRLVYTADIPAPDRTATGLVSEIGRVRVISLDYILPIADVVEPDPITVTIDGSVFALVSTPTRTLYMQTTLAASDGVGAAISEFGMFAEASVDGALPPGQQFYSGAEITDPGSLMLLRHEVPAPHSGAHSLGTQFSIEL